MSIKLKGSSDGSVSFDAPADTSPSGSDITLTLPTSVGSANQFLKNSGIAGELEYSSMVETSTGVGIGTSSPSRNLTVSNGTNAIIAVQNSGQSTEGVFNAPSGGTINLGTSGSYDLTLSTNSAERMRLDSSGRLLVGNTSSAGNSTLQVQGLTGLDARGAIQLQYNGSPSGSTTMSEVRFTDSSGNQGAVIGARSASTWASNDYPGELTFSTTADGSQSPTERMRITSGGTLLLNGATSNPTGATTSLYTDSANNAAEGITIKSPATSGNRFMIGFYNNANSKVGDIVYNGTSTAYNTTSDYRLKENVVAVTDGITRIKQLNPSRFNFIGNTETTVDGFLAHEVQSVVSEAVTGEHNGVDDSGNPVYQSIDQSKLVPLLTAALQEAIAKIETLETKVAALEAA